jgi:hypothetical protein
MAIKRKSALAIRNAIGEIEALILRDDRSPEARLERDLAATACVAFWEADWKVVLRCLRKLSERGADARKGHWTKLYELTCAILHPAPVAQAA